MQKRKIIGILFFITLNSIFPADFYAEGINPIKQEIWDNMSYDIDHWVDATDNPIHKEIEETVVALNLLGIETIASCEGHFDHGCLYPWIDLQIFSSEMIKPIVEMGKKIEQISIEEKLLEGRFPDLSYQDLLDLPEAELLRVLFKERILLLKTIEQTQMNCLEPLNIFLNQFYENRNVPYDRVLVILSEGRLQSHGAERQLIRSEEEQNLKLVEYREEMKAFASFLKQINL